jgi:hypothetical protein
MKRKRLAAKRAVGYVRPSDWLLIGEEVSLHYQREKIKRYCEDRDLELVSIVEGSRGTLKDPIGYKASSLAIEHEAGSVVCVWLDTVFTDVGDLGRIGKQWENLGIIVHLLLPGKEVAVSRKSDGHEIANVIGFSIMIASMIAMEEIKDGLRSEVQMGGT